MPESLTYCPNCRINIWENHGVLREVRTDAPWHLQARRILGPPTSVFCLFRCDCGHSWTLTVPARDWQAWHPHLPSRFHLP